MPVSHPGIYAKRKWRTRRIRTSGATSVRPALRRHAGGRRRQARQAEAADGSSRRNPSNLNLLLGTGHVPAICRCQHSTTDSCQPPKRHPDSFLPLFPRLLLRPLTSAIFQLHSQWLAFPLSTAAKGSFRAVVAPSPKQCRNVGPTLPIVIAAIAVVSPGGTLSASNGPIEAWFDIQAPQLRCGGGWRTIEKY